MIDESAENHTLQYYVDETGSGQPVRGRSFPAIQSKAKVVVSARFSTQTFEWIEQLKRMLPEGQSLEEPAHVAHLVISDPEARRILDANLERAAILLVDPLAPMRSITPEVHQLLRTIRHFPPDLRWRFDSYCYESTGLGVLERKLGNAIQMPWSFSDEPVEPRARQILSREVLRAMKWQTCIEGLTRLAMSMLDAVDPEFEDALFANEAPGARILVTEFSARPLRAALRTMVTFDVGKAGALPVACDARGEIAEALKTHGPGGNSPGQLVEKESSSTLGLVAAHLAAYRAVETLDAAHADSQSVASAVLAVASRFERVFLNLQRIYTAEDAQ